MQLKKFLARFILLTGLTLTLQSCQFVKAQSGNVLTFTPLKPVKEWNHLGKDVPKELLEKFKSDHKDLLDSWMGEPGRFPVYIQKTFGGQTLFFINPRVECPEWGCPKESEIYFQYYAPFCNSREHFCLITFYVKQNAGFHSVFADHFSYQGNGDRNIFAFSEQQQNGLPSCFEVKGFSLSSKYDNKLPPKPEGDRYVSRYCYNGQKYELDKIYTEQWDWLIEEHEK